MKEQPTFREFISLPSLFPVGRKPMGIFDFTNQIDRIYTGLGIPVLYGVLSILANKSVFFIGGRGIGKTRIIRSIPNVSGTEVSKWDTFTLGELNDYCCDVADPHAGCVRNKHLVFKVEEFSTLSDYHREIFLTVCSKIISDGNYRHVARHTPCLDIQNCKLTLLIAIQPGLYSMLCRRYTQWESMSYDRFTKFIMLNPLRSETVDASFIPTLPRKITAPAYNGRDLDLSRVNSLFNRQISAGRAYLYARDYVIALAGFMGSKRVEQSHVETFYQLFNPYLDSFSRLQEAQDLESPVMVKSGRMKLLAEIGKYNSPVEKQKLADDLYVTPRHIERCAKGLIHAGLIDKPERGQYCLSEELSEYFKWYEDKFNFPT